MAGAGVEETCGGGGVGRCWIAGARAEAQAAIVRARRAVERTAPRYYERGGDVQPRNVLLLLGFVTSGCNLILGNQDVPYAPSDGGPSSSDQTLSDSSSDRFSGDSPVPEDGNLESGARFMLAAGQSFPWGVAVDDLNVYWVTQDNDGGGAVRQCRKMGCSMAPTTLASLTTEAPFLVTTSGTAVYWSSTNSIWGCDRSCCGAPIQFSSSASAYDLAADDAGVYWFDTATGYVKASSPLGPCGSDGGSTVNQLARVGLTSNAVAVAGGMLYWDDSFGNLSEVDTNGLNQQLVTSGLGQLGPIAANTSLVYALTGAGAPSGPQVYVVLVPDAGTVLSIGYSNAHPAFAIALDSTAAYWTVDSNVWSAPLGNDVPHVFATDPMQGKLAGIAVDDVAVYWASASGVIWAQVK